MVRKEKYEQGWVLWLSLEDLIESQEAVPIIPVLLFFFLPRRILFVLKWLFKKVIPELKKGT